MDIGDRVMHGAITDADMEVGGRVMHGAITERGINKILRVFCPLGSLRSCKFVPDEFVEHRVQIKSSHSQYFVKWENPIYKKYGGERGIRTLDTFNRIHTFQACSFSHSDTSPAAARLRHIT